MTSGSGTRSATEDSGAVGMRWIPGGRLKMGSDDFYENEKPVHTVSVDGFGSKLIQSRSTSSEGRRRGDPS